MGRRRYSDRYRRKRSRGRFAASSLLFWAVSGLIMLVFLHGGPSQFFQAKSEDVAKMYVGSVFPTVSRSADSRDPITELPGKGEATSEGGKTADDENGTLAENKKEMLKTMVGTMFPAAEVLDDDLAEEDPGIDFSKMTDNEENASESTKEGNDQVIDTQNPKEPKPATANIDYSKPVVIIYHTHATESYQPISDGNFHSLPEPGTVREVGDVLTEALEAKGIQVIHDKTIHDSPSYNQSYTRSLETIQKLIGNNESARIIIDLHRDAASYSGNVAKTVTINKDMAAKYSLVIGKGNPNVEALRVFANHVNATAEKMYPGFGGKIIEKQYKFNQYVSDYYLLLEVGNNQNTIDQAKLTGKYFADVMAQVIKDIQ